VNAQQDPVTVRDVCQQTAHPPHRPAPSEPSRARVARKIRHVGRKPARSPAVGAGRHDAVRLVRQLRRASDSPCAAGGASVDTIVPGRRAAGPHAMSPRGRQGDAAQLTTQSANLMPAALLKWVAQDCQPSHPLSIGTSESIPTPMKQAACGIDSSTHAYPCGERLGTYRNRFFIFIVFFTRHADRVGRHG
jgi:hypothetical protein